MAYKISLKRPEEKESALIVEFMKNAQRFKFYTGKTVQTKNWNHKKQIVRDTEENHQQINNYLEIWEKELRRIIGDMESNKERLNQDVIKSRLEAVMKKDGHGAKDKAPEDLDFIAFYDQFIKSRSHCVRSTISVLKQNKKHVICAMQLVSRSVLNEYDKLSVKKRGVYEFKHLKRLPLTDINESFLATFVEYLQTVKFTRSIRGVELELNYKKNYIAKQTKQIKQTIRASFKKGVTPFDMSEFKARFEDVDSIYTSFEELQKFVDLDLEGREKIIRDLYVLNCFLGMRFSDLCGIQPHHFSSQTVDGKKYVVYTGRQLKTGTIVEFPVHKNATRILELYNYQLPPVTDAEFNKLIKIVALKAGLTGLFTKRETRGHRDTTYNNIPKYQLISSHTGRRSFCTNYKVAGWDIQSIMSVSGHKTEEEFLKYVKAGAKINVLLGQMHKIPELRVLKIA